MFAKTRIHFLAVTIGLILLAATACKKDGLAPAIDRTTLPRSLGEFIQNNYDLSLLSAALTKTGLIDSLKTGGPFTFFAPDNAAFNTIGIGNTRDFDKMDTDSLRQALKNCIIKDRYYISDFPYQMDNKFTTLAGNTIYISVGGNSANAADARMVAVNGAYVSDGSKRNIALANGVVHMIRKPLKYYVETVQDFIAKDSNLVLFAVAMKKFGLWDALKTASSLTVYAPENAAFLKYGLTADSIGRMDTALYKSLAFGVYPLLLQPRHIFSTDGYLINNGTIYGPSGIKIGAEYSFLPNYYGYNNTEVFSLSMVQWYGNFWQPNLNGNTSFNYKNNSLANADYLTTNGIINIINDLIFYPEQMKK